MRRFLETLAEADRAPRRRRPLGRHRRPVAVRPRRPASDRDPRRRARREPLGDEGRRGASLPRLPHRRDPRRAPDARSRSAACASSRASARRPSSTSTRRSTRPAATPARSSSSSAPPRRNDVRLLLLMDVGGTMDPYLRAGEPAAHRAARGARPARLPALLLPQLHLRSRLHERPHGSRRRGADRRRAAPPRQPLEGGHRRRRARCTPPSCSTPTATSIRGVTTADAGDRLAAAHRRPLRARGLDQPGTGDCLGSLADDAPRAAPVSDVSAHHGRCHRRDARAGRIAGLEWVESESCPFRLSALGQGPVVAIAEDR